MIDEECRCDCHRNQDGMETRHMGPCCIKCHFCSKNIPIFSVIEHQKRCNMPDRVVIDIFNGIQNDYVI